MDVERPVSEHAEGSRGARDEAVAAELERILASAAFRNARRSQDFLRYIVTNALEGRSDCLKERTIGVNVFQRTPDYDTGEDSIVRVKASELRKRLAQYYNEAGPEHEIRIELPAGSYVPEFRAAPKPSEAVAPSSPEVRRRRASRVLLPAALAVVVLVTIWYVLPARTSVLDQFWEPVFRSSRPVMLCVAHPVVYHAYGSTREILQGDPANKPETILVPSTELVRDPDHYVGIGDAYALAQLSGFLNRHGKAVTIRFGDDTSFAELRNSPAVLIGAFTNQWTMQMTSNLRFVFEQPDGRAIIRDQMDPSRFWQLDSGKPSADYVVLSRIFDSRSGEIVITAAGIGHAGTQMAGEFLTNAAYLEQALRSAPHDWQTRNLQLVLTGEVIGKTPGPPKVAASWYW